MPTTATRTLRPDGTLNNSPAWGIVGAATVDGAVGEATVYPANGDLTTRLAASASGKDATVSLGTFTLNTGAGEAVTGARLYCYGDTSSNTSTPSATIELRALGSVLATTTIPANIGVTGVAWFTADYTGALTQAQIDDLQIRFVSVGSGINLVRPATAYADVFTSTPDADTTPPAGVTANINAGAAATATQAVTLAIATTDTPTTGYQVKVWGDVDTSANANIQATEAASSWFAYTTSQAVTLSAGDATKTLNVKVRDVALNESTPASDTIVLDTTGPAGLAASINAGAATTATQAVTLATTTTDSPTTGYQMKVWGDVDTTADANVQATEAASAWITYAASKAITLSAGDAVKTLNVKVRDTLLNESSTSDTITLSTVVTPPPGVVGLRIGLKGLHGGGIPHAGGRR